MISHPFMSLAQPRDPPRVLPIQQYDTFVELDLYQQPMVAAAPDEVDVDVYHLRHAVVIFFFWYLCLLLSFVFYY